MRELTRATSAAYSPFQELLVVILTRMTIIFARVIPQALLFNYRRVP